VAVFVTEVLVEGADTELQQIARNAIRTQVGQTTTATALQQDIAAVLETGWFATVTVLTRATPQGIAVTFQLAPIVVRSLQLSGAQALTPDIANQLFQPQLGNPANSALLSQAVQRTNAWYAQNGLPLARVLTVQPSRTGVVTIAVAEGTVRSVRVRFLSPEGKTVDANGQPIRVRTQPAFVQRQIQLQPGQPFRTDVAQADLRRLSQLGIFQTANVSFEGDARQTDVIYNVVEGKARGFNFGGGYNDELGLYATINYQDVNFAGLAQQLNANVQVGTQDIQYNLRFQSPYRATDPGTPGYGISFFRRQGLSRVFDDEIKLPNGSRVRERRLGGGINLDYPVFGPEWATSLGLNYTNISLRDRDGDVFRTDRRGNPLSLSGKGIDDLYTVSFSATRDRRDDPRNSSRGSLLSFSTEQSIPIGRGEILGNRLTASYSQYIPVELIKFAKADQQFSQVFAFNVQGGTVIGDLPPYDAFTLGGPSSVRGYESGAVATSRSYLLLSTEYRFPIYRFIGGALFADFATDLGSQDRVLGDPGGERDKPGSGFGGGVGLRFNSPIGIIRADFGISNQGDARLQFGFGQRF
jgi:outer membrane protein insertion porin family